MTVGAGVLRSAFLIDLKRKELGMRTIAPERKEAQ